MGGVSRIWKCIFYFGELVNRFVIVKFFTQTNFVTSNNVQDETSAHRSILQNENAHCLPKPTNSGLRSTYVRSKDQKEPKHEYALCG